MSGGGEGWVAGWVVGRGSVGVGSSGVMVELVSSIYDSVKMVPIEVQLIFSFENSLII